MKLDGKTEAEEIRAADRQKTDRVADLRLCLPPGQPEKGLQGTRPWGLTCPAARIHASRTCAVVPPFHKSKRRRYPIHSVPMLSRSSPCDLLIPTRPLLGNRIFHWANWKKQARSCVCSRSSIVGVASLIVEQRLHTGREGRGRFFRKLTRSQKVCG